MENVIDNKLMIALTQLTIIVTLINGWKKDTGRSFAQ
jgi:hypothetical protein